MRRGQKRRYDDPYRNRVSFRLSDQQLRSLQMLVGSLNMANEGEALRHLIEQHTASSVEHTQLEVIPATQTPVRLPKVLEEDDAPLSDDGMRPPAITIRGTAIAVDGGSISSDLQSRPIARYNGVEEPERFGSIRQD